MSIFMVINIDIRLSNCTFHKIDSLIIHNFYLSHVTVCPTSYLLYYHVQPVQWRAWRAYAKELRGTRARTSGCHAGRCETSPTLLSWDLRLLPHPEKVLKLISCPLYNLQH